MQGTGNQTSNSGSRWHRWEPHIHAPGTVLNDQFTGDDAWERYLAALEALTPEVRALSVTDYYSLDCYERVIQAKAQGRLPSCALVFPNIEMRLAYGTVKGRWANIHLLVDPSDPDHVAETKRFLARLTFEVKGDTFACSHDELVRLGSYFDPLIKDAAAAHEQGALQFKVDFLQLQKLYDASAWAKANIMIAVAGGADGVSGIRDAADALLRRNVQTFAHVIFTSNPKDRLFWIGKGVMAERDVCERYGSLKPCLHGSDAHNHETVGVPTDRRFSWVKGEPCFDTLRQAYIDPENRAFVGPEPPISAVPSHVISAVRIAGAPWAKTPVLWLNPGLVTIIGARGSGKTALADMIAAGCDALPDGSNQASFLNRARDLLGGSAVHLVWGDGETTEAALNAPASFDFPADSRARYLSQQFVETLCSADGVTDALLREIERVIFEAHGLSDRDGAFDFQELLEMRAGRHRQARDREEIALESISERIGTELDKEKQVAELKRQVAAKQKLIKGYEADRSRLTVKGSELRVRRLAELTAAAEKVRGNIRFYSTRQQSLLELKDDVADLRRNRAPEALRSAKERYRASGISEPEWSPFLLDYKGNVDADIQKRLTEAQTSANSWKGTPVAPAADPSASHIADDAELVRQPLSLLEAEMARLEKLIGVDRDTANRFSLVARRIAEETVALERLAERLADCEQAHERRLQLVRDREASYARVFEALLAEQDVLVELYGPLMERLKSAQGTVRKLSFSVSRVANVGRWAEDGEENLLDRRKLGPFKGVGKLRTRANETLRAAWETGTAEDVTKAMAQFRALNQDGLLEHSPFLKEDQADYRAWLKRFAQWLYGTSHISIRYSIDHDGVDIRKLSPGTRGIVLLLLYLALDDADDRPLIIDQPEENLDPKSIFDELVGLFVGAKAKRQVIMVTHNANLVINTDADQIIVARAGHHQPGELPTISYESGGLENAAIRTAVCEILEGGEEAFKARARRLRVRLER